MTQPSRSASLPMAALTAALAAMLCLAVAAGPARAQTVEPYVVTVHVDVEAESAEAARQAAMRQGQRMALRRLFERLTLPEDHGRLPEVDPARIDHLVQSFQLANERTSNVRYIADMTVRFQPQDVRGILQQAGINYIDSPSKPVVVLPVWQSPDGPVLWDDPNPWRQAWARSVPPGGLIPVIVPLGGLDDLQLIDARQAVGSDAEPLAAIGAHYDAGEVLVAIADPAQGAATLRRFTVSVGQGGQAGRHALPEGEGPEAYAPLVETIVRELEQRWKQSNMVAGGVPQEMDVRVPLATFDTWVLVRSRLEQVNLVKQIQVRSLSRSEALLSLSYLGDVPRLQTALRQRDLVLTRDGSGAGTGAPAWLLRLAEHDASGQPGGQGQPGSTGAQQVVPPPGSGAAGPAASE